MKAELVGGAPAASVAAVTPLDGRKRTFLPCDLTIL